MTLRQFFDANKLRQSLLKPEEPESRRHCLSTARLVAAFYLGLPLFELENPENGYPTLFQWVQLSENDRPGRAVTREVAAQELPEHFSARLPIAILLNLAQDLEAVLYADHFCDRRSSLLLRILVDDTLGLCLTDEYVADFLLGVVQKQGLNVPFLCDQLIPSVVELDVVLSKTYIRSLEIHLLERIDLLFAKLPLKCSDPQLLPRPPVYMLGTTDVKQGEALTLARIHTLLKMVLTSLHLTNRLQTDLKRTMSIFAEPDAKLSGGGAIVTRLSVTVLSLIYRDSFSLAEQEKWSSLPEVAMKYKALIEGENEQQAVQRWHSLADQQDVAHIQLFFEFIKNTFQGGNGLPSLDNSTRELWHSHLCHEEEVAYSARESTDWVSGLLLIHRMVDHSVWEQMKFVATRWRGLALPDSTLIPLRLHVSPDILCKQLSAPLRQAQTAREQMESARSAREERMFLTRTQILEEYTLRAKEELAARRLKEKRRAVTHREPRFMRSTINSLNIQKIAETQAELSKTIKTEKQFLKSPTIPASSRHSLSSPCSSNSSSLSSTSNNLREDVIRKDIKKLDDKIEQIGKMLVEERRRQADLRQTEEVETERSESVASSLQPLPDNYNEVPAAPTPPLVEKLDFTMLSPSPRPVRPISPDTEGDGEEVDVADEVRSQLSMLSMSTAHTLQEMPSPSSRSLPRPQTERLPLLHYARTEGTSGPSPVIGMVRPQVATSERSAQTTSQVSLGQMKPMSRMDISALYKQNV